MFGRVLNPPLYSTQWCGAKPLRYSILCCFWKTLLKILCLWLRSFFKYKTTQKIEVTTNCSKNFENIYTKFWVPQLNFTRVSSLKPQRCLKWAPSKTLLLQMFGTYLWNSLISVKLQIPVYKDSERRFFTFCLRFFRLVIKFYFSFIFVRVEGTFLGIIHLVRTQHISHIRTYTCVYQGVRNVSFSENFAYIQNEWSLMIKVKFHACISNFIFLILKKGSVVFWF